MRATLRWLPAVPFDPVSLWIKDAAWKRGEEATATISIHSILSFFSGRVFPGGIL